MNLDTYIENLYNAAQINFREHLEMLYIQAKSFTKESVNKNIDEKLIDEYLKKRGYTMNYILNKRVMIKDFTCVFVNKKHIEIWHDKSQNKELVFINESYLTNLPITLNYMERI